MYGARQLFLTSPGHVGLFLLLKAKSKVGTIFPIFYNMVKNQFGVEIKRFRFDNAKNYFNQSLSLFFQQKGIIHESSCPYTPQQNGEVEKEWPPLGYY